MSLPTVRETKRKQPPTKTARPRVAKIIEVDPVDRAERAHALHVEGKSWAEIARTIGYISAQVAQMAVTAYLQRAALELGPELRHAALMTELDRLDLVNGAFLPKAMEGGYKAADVVMRVHDRRSALLRLASDVALAAQPKSIIISDSERMAQELRGAALESLRGKVEGGGEDRFLRQMEQTPIDGSP